jgi:hypothetical protein
VGWGEKDGGNLVSEYITNGSYNNPSVHPITHVTIWIRVASGLTHKGAPPPALSTLRSPDPTARICHVGQAPQGRLRLPPTGSFSPPPTPVALALLAVPANVAAVVYKLRFLRLCTLSNRPVALRRSPCPPRPPRPPLRSSSSGSPPPPPHLPLWL